MVTAELILIWITEATGRSELSKLLFKQIHFDFF